MPPYPDLQGTIARPRSVTEGDDRMYLAARMPRNNSPENVSLVGQRNERIPPPALVSVNARRETAKFKPLILGEVHAAANTYSRKDGGRRLAPLSGQCNLRANKAQVTAIRGSRHSGLGSSPDGVGTVLRALGKEKSRSDERFSGAPNAGRSKWPNSKAAEVDSRPLIDFRCLKPACTPRHSRGSAGLNIKS